MCAEYGKINILLHVFDLFKMIQIGVMIFKGTFLIHVVLKIINTNIFWTIIIYGVLNKIKYNKDLPNSVICIFRKKEKNI